MDYGRIVEQAWRLTWRNRFLWIFGLFAGPSGGGGCSFNYNQRLPSSTGNGPGGLPRGFPGTFAFNQWVVDHLALILAGFAVFFVLGLVFLVLHFVAKGALIGSAARLAMGETVTRGEGWALGRRYAWTYGRLSVLMFAVVLAVLLVVLLLAGVVVLLFRVSTALGIVVAVLLGLGALAAFVVGGIALIVVFTYAERAIAIDELGARAAVRRGMALVRLRLGPSLLLWLVSFVLLIVIGVVFAVVAVATLLPIGGAVFAAYLAAGLSGPTIALGGVGLIVFFLVLWAIGGLTSAYSSTFWTLGYLSATSRLSPPVAPE